MRSTICAALIFGAVAPASAADIAVRPLEGGGTMVGLYGEIVSDDFEAFRSKTAMLTGRVVVALESPGGTVVDALRIGEYLRLKGWATVSIPRQSRGL